MLKFATQWCDLWCPEYPPCNAFEPAGGVPTPRCLKCDHPERCHAETAGADEEGTFDGDPNPTGDGE